MKVTPDLGDSSTLPKRVQWAFLSSVGIAFVVGLVLVIAGARVWVAGIVVANLGLVLEWLFTRGRPWWGDEPGVANMIGPNPRRQAISIVVLDALAVALVSIGVLHV